MGVTWTPRVHRLQGSHDFNSNWMLVTVATGMMRMMSQQCPGRGSKEAMKSSKRGNRDRNMLHLLMAVAT